MRKILFLFIAAGLCARADAATPTFFTMDNVPNYSSNPLWRADGAYNQGFPTPVYVRGPSLGAAECQSVVNSAIWTQCSYRNNCAGVNLVDIKPSIVMELSTRTDNNYSTACVGYIDNLFLQYKQQNPDPVMAAPFPAAGVGNGGGIAVRQNAFTYENLTPYYEQQKDARKYELIGMQMQTGGQPQLAPTAMPATFDDLSFTEKMDVWREGWQDPAVNQVPTYANLKVESDEKRDERIVAAETAKASIEAQKAAAEQSKLNAAIAEYKATHSLDDFCKKYPGDADCKARDERSNQLSHEKYLADQNRLAAEAAARNAGNNGETNGAAQRLLDEAQWLGGGFSGMSTSDRKAMIESLSNSIRSQLKE